MTIPWLLLASLAPAPALPPKILSAYAGYWLDKEPETAWFERYVEPFAAAGFTCLEFKIHPASFDLADPLQQRRLARLAHEVTSRGLVLLADVYPNPDSGRRDPARHATLPAVVDAMGRADSQHFSLVHFETWRALFDNAFQLARASLTLPITAVTIDVETLHSTAISYDPAAVARFAAARGLAAVPPADGVGAWLTAQGLREAYETWFVAEFEAVIGRFARELQAINSRLHFGMMPAHRSWFYEAFQKHLATPAAPGVMAHWGMYNGGGFGPDLLAEQERVKALNPHNLFVPWFRINNYRPDSIPPSAYRAARLTAGYGNWTSAMLDPEVGRRNALYRLPQDYAAEQYLAAYGRANREILADLADPLAADRIAWSAPVPLAPPLKLEGLAFPPLQPAGAGGAPVWVTLRNQRTIYFAASAGLPVKIDLTHLAPQIAVGLHHVVVGPDHQTACDGLVAPGQEASLTFTPAGSGLHGLVVSGGEDGLAWYRVRIHAAQVAVATPAYFFRGPGEFYLTRSDPTAPAALRLGLGREQIWEVRLDDEPPRLMTETLDLELPPGREGYRVRFRQPATLPPGRYTQDLLVSVSGAVTPALALTAEGRWR